MNNLLTLKIICRHKPPNNGPSDGFNCSLFFTKFGQRKGFKANAL